MLARMVMKLLFKACVPLVAVAGVMTYGVYLKGGDPAALWGHVADGAFARAGAMFTQVKNDAAGIAGNLTSPSDLTAMAAGESHRTEVFKWKDADGVTHFGTSAPQGIAAQSVMVDPNVNILAPVTTPVVYRDERSSSENENAATLSSPPASADGHTGSVLSGKRAQQTGDAVRQLESEMGEPLPGLAGQLLSSGSAGAEGVDATQLIRLLQSAGH